MSLVCWYVAGIGDNLVQCFRERKWLTVCHHSDYLHIVGYLCGIPRGSGLEYKKKKLLSVQWEIKKVQVMKDNQSTCCLWLGDLSGNYEVYYKKLKEVHVSMKKD